MRRREKRQRISKLVLSAVLIVGLLPMTSLFSFAETVSEAGNTSETAALEESADAADATTATNATEEAQDVSAATAEAPAEAALTTTSTTSAALETQSVSGDLATYVTSSSLTVGGVAYTKGMTVAYGDKLVGTIKWAIPNSISVKAGDTLTYTMPSNVSWSTYEGNLMDGSNTVGTYSISGTALTVTYTTDMGSDITGSVALDGTIAAKSIGDNNGGDKTIVFPGGGTYNVSVKPNSKVSAAKAYEKATDADNAFDFVVAVSSTGPNTNVTVADTMGSLLSLYDGGVSVYTDSACTIAYIGSYSSTGNTAGAQSFTTTIDSMTDGQTLYVKYRASGSTAKISLTSDYNARVNNAKVTSTQDTTGSTASKDVWVGKTWSLSKAGTANADGSAITWTVVINSGDNSDIAGTTVKDALGSGLTAPTTVTIEKSTDGTNWSASDVAITWEQLAAGTFTLPSSKGVQYRITYTTPITDPYVIGSTTYSNDVTVNPYGNTDYAQKATGTVGVGTDATIINKECTTTGSTSTTQTWKSSITIPATVTSLDNVVYTDTLSTNATLDTSSIQVFTDAACTQVYTGSYTKTSTDAQGFTLDFGALAGGTNLYVTYGTSLKSGNETSSQTVTNEAQVTASHLPTQSSEAKYVYTVAKHLSKYSPWNIGGKFSWVLKLEQVDSSVQSVTITDTLPVNQSFVEGSIVAIPDYYYQTTKYSGVTAVVNDDGTVTFTVAGDALAAAKTRSIEIAYKTTLTDYTKVTANTRYVNTAQVTIDNNTEVPVTAETWAGKPDLLDKTYVYTGETAPLINYTVAINPGALDLVSGSTTLQLTDTMGSALQLKLGTICVNGTNISQLVNQGYSYSYDPESRVMTVSVPDNTAITLTYSAIVMNAVGSELNATNAYNTVGLTGVDSSKYDKTVSISGSVLESKGVSSSDGHSLQVFKYKDDKTTNALAGAVFTVEKLSFNSTTGTNWAVANATATGTLTSTGTGYTNSLAALAADTIYRITETTTPEGYDTAEPVYLVFRGNDAAGYGNFENITITDTFGSHALTATNQQSYISYISDKTTAPDTHAISVSKVDGVSGKALAGATLQVSDAKGNAVGTWTSDGTSHALSLAAGTYTLSETTAPTGYQTAAAITFTVASDGTLSSTTAGAVSGTTLTMADSSQTTSVKATKVWSDSSDAAGNRPTDITVNLLANGTKVASKTISAGTSWACSFDDLAAYADGAKIAYTVTEDTVEGYASEITGSAETGFTITNTATTHAISVSKVDATDGATEIDGAHLTITNAAGTTTYADWTSSSKGSKNVYLQPGNYVLHEKTAPTNYDLAQDIAFTVNADGTVTSAGKTLEGAKVVMEDARTHYDVSFTKVDHADGNAKLAGSHLQLTKGNGRTGEVVADWYSSATAEKDLKLEAGTYTLAELEAPAGFDLAPDITFTVGNIGSIALGTMSGYSVTAASEAKATLSATTVTSGDANSSNMLATLEADGSARVTIADAKLAVNTTTTPATTTPDTPTSTVSATGAPKTGDTLSPWFIVVPVLLLAIGALCVYLGCRRAKSKVRNSR